MRWLLRKDLLILRRSRLLLALLVIYPVAIALLLGFALSRGPARPRVAILDQVPAGETIIVGRQRLAVAAYVHRLFDQLQAVPVSSRAQAVAKVDSGAVVAAIVLPANLAARLSSDLTQARLEVLYNGNALDQSLARQTISSALAQANIGFSEQVQKLARGVIGTLLTGGRLGSIGAPASSARGESSIGLNHIPAVLGAIAARQPTRRARAQLEEIDAFAGFAAQNLTIASRVLATIGQPITVAAVLLHGRRTPLDDFAVVVAVSVSLMFVCVLLAAGAVALEREEHALARLLRTLVSREALLAEKTLLAAGCAFPVALALLAGIGAFIPLDWGRAGMWLAALALGALAFAALGVAVGVFAREVRAASLLAFLLSLPLAFLALVPSGSVSHGFYEAIAVVSFAFPYKAALEALDTAVNGAAPALGLSLAHLALLAAVFGALARLGLREVE
ncbi:MAG TPA: ABC transporter permease [Solirubrobacteraceae bacterium]|jgi:ABC-2 type transport system permease protein|nr:ABC transporter permease [Solirubrobacteraceae bacterium]